MLVSSAWRSAVVTLGHAAVSFLRPLCVRLVMLLTFWRTDEGLRDEHLCQRYSHAEHGAASRSGSRGNLGVKLVCARPARRWYQAPSSRARSTDAAEDSDLDCGYAARADLAPGAVEMVFLILALEFALPFPRRQAC